MVAPEARAVLAGIHGGTTRANVARAALEGIAWRVADIVAAMRETVDVDTLRVDGGLTNEPLMLELQADAIGVPVEAGGADATVAGAAALAAVGAGMIASLEEAAELLPVDRRVEPARDDAWRTAEHERWRGSCAAAATALAARARPRRGGGWPRGRASRRVGSLLRRCPCPRRTRSSAPGPCSASWPRGSSQPTHEADRRRRTSGV